MHTTDPRPDQRREGVGACPRSVSNKCLKACWGRILQLGQQFRDSWRPPKQNLGVSRTAACWPLTDGHQGPCGPWGQMAKSQSLKLLCSPSTVARLVERMRTLPAERLAGVLQTKESAGMRKPSQGSRQKKCGARRFIHGLSP